MEKNKKKNNLLKLVNSTLIYNLILIILLIIGAVVIKYVDTTNNKVILNGRELSKEALSLFKDIKGKTYVSLEDFVNSTHLYYETKMFKINNSRYDSKPGQKEDFFIDSPYEAVQMNTNSKEYVKYIKYEYLDRRVDKDGKLEKNEKEKANNEEVKKREKDKMDTTIINLEKFQLKENIVVDETGKKYVTLEDAKYIFNMDFQESSNKKRIHISTIDYLEALIQNQLVAKNYTLHGNFQNRRAIIDRLIVVVSTEGTLGINEIDMAGNVTKNNVSTQYNDLRYVQNTKTAYVLKGTNIGLVDSVNGKVIIALGNYETLETYLEEKGIYLVSRNKRYGLLGNDGSELVPIEFGKIGYDASVLFPNEQVNGKLLFDNIVPVMKDNKWGFYSIQKSKDLILKNLFSDLGYRRLELVTSAYSDSKTINIPEEIVEAYASNGITIKRVMSIEEARQIGFTNNQNEVKPGTESVLIVPEDTGFGGIVVKNDQNKYGIVSPNTRDSLFVLPFNWDRIYKKVLNGETRYFAESESGEFELTSRNKPSASPISNTGGILQTQSTQGQTQPQVQEQRVQEQVPVELPAQSTQIQVPSQGEVQTQSTQGQTQPQVQEQSYTSYV